MNRHPLRFALLSVAALVFVANLASSHGQQAEQYQGVSKPPAEQMKTTSDVPASVAKPSPAVVAAPPPSQAEGSTMSSDPVVAPASQPTGEQSLTRRQPAADPDGDIVQPRQARPGELLSGSTLKVRLLDRLASRDSQKGEPFHGEVVYDVVQGGQMLIPSGSKVEGKVVMASGGHFGGHGSLRLKPESVTLPDGTQYELRAEVTGTLGSKTRMGSEGAINPGSRTAKDGVEYGAVVGVGATTGAIVAGPVGALAGGLIGAGVVTTHLMVDHPQTTLEAGSIVFFTLTDSLEMTPRQAN